MAYNLNYPDYSQYGGMGVQAGQGDSGVYSNLGSGLNSGGDAAIQNSGGNPYAIAAGAAAKVAGFGLSAYAAYKQAQREEAALKEEQRRYEEEKRVREEERNYQKYLNRVAQAFGAGTYSQNLEDRLLQNYGHYAT